MTIRRVFDENLGVYNENLWVSDEMVIGVSDSSPMMMISSQSPDG